jgi:predicted metal-dependent hydrolase
MSEKGVDKIIRSKRRTLALQVTSEGLIVVRAPQKATQKVISQFIDRYERWIARQRARIQAHTIANPPKKYIEGEQFLFLGEYHKLCVVDDPDTVFRYDNCFYINRNHLGKARLLIGRWYVQAARIAISERVNHYCNLTGLIPRRLSITNASSRWGSCSANNNVRFSWRLVMAPQRVIDYVVVHELAHIAVKNHSKSFWQKVESIMPDYKLHRQWLKTNGRLLDL